MTKHPFFNVLKNRNLRLLWLGEGISVLGSQFYLIALPWLVLKLTGDPLQMGTVLALAGIPRALFMLVGGVLTDRFSPKSMMIYSNAVRMTVGFCLGLLIIYDLAAILIIYFLSLMFGLADAFLYPAQSAMMPKVVKRNQLLAGNSIVQGTAQLSIAVGPALAGLIIAVLSPESNDANSASSRQLFGVSIAFFVNAAAFLLSIIIFSKIKVENDDHSGATGEKKLLAYLKEGLDFVFSDKTFLYLLLIAAISHFLVEGPLFIGIPLLAHTILPEGAAAFGIIMSALGAGMLCGILAAGVLPPLNPNRMGRLLVLLIGLSGAGLVLIGLSYNTYSIAVTTCLMGAAQGYVIVQFSTWVQVRAPSQLLGRVLSMMMFASVGLVPVSQAICGALIKLSVSGLFIGAGIGLTVFNILMMFTKEVRDMGLTATHLDRIN